MNTIPAIFWFQAACILILTFCGLVLGVILAILFMFRDRRAHPMHRVEIALTMAFSAFDRAFYWLIDWIAGVKAEKISKRKARELLRK